MIHFDIQEFGNDNWWEEVYDDLDVNDIVEKTLDEVNRRLKNTQTHRARIEKMREQRVRDDPR